MLPYAWRLSISVARIALGSGCLIWFAGSSTLYWGLAPLLGFVLYSFYALRRSLEAGGIPLVTLAVDTLSFVAWYFLTAEAFGGGFIWLAINTAIYIFLLSSAVLTQEWTKAVGVAIVCGAAVIAGPRSTVPMQPVVLWCTVLAAVWLLHRRFLEERLSRAAQHSVIYRFEAQNAREEERQRIAADFHDGPLQSFIGFQMRLEIVKKMLARDPGAASEELRQLQELCRSQVGELRAFVRSMRPSDFEGSSLGASISRMVEQFQKDTGITTSFSSTGYLEPRETETSLEVLQIVREALNNIQKHSHASQVSVALGKKDEDLEISIDDNGAGFPFSGSFTLEELDLLRLGPVSIRRRVRALGGDMQVDSKPGQGAGLKVRVSM